MTETLLLASELTAILCCAVFSGAALYITLVPTNHRLLDPALNGASAEARTLLSRWGKLHAVRSVTSLAALTVLVTVVAAR